VWGFGGRAFYPPPDPINAMLSFGYTLALHDVITAVQISGLDTYLGVFHVIEPGRPSLALDLLEEFRPLIVNRLVIDLVRTNAIGREHFHRPQERAGAVYLNDVGRTLLVQRYESMLQTKVRLPGGEQTLLHRVILLQAQAIARIVRGEQEQYTGFSLNN
jgi:CRISPR-associated protein, Cas1 family